MRKEIVIVGLNHRSAPIEVRESVAFESAYLHDALTRLRNYSSIDEGVILSTCNRVEVVAAASDSTTAYSEIGRFLSEQKAQRHGIALTEHTYQYRGVEAIRHLFRVAASLDSMVVGEPQILGQLKQHYDAAQQAGSVGTILHRLFHRSFSVAKRVRSETGIGSGAVSLSSVAVDLAKRIFDRFDDKTVMLIGAGKMGDLMARHLQSHGVRSLMVTNRTFERAVELAERIHGNPIRFEDFPQYLKMADLVIGCTGAPEVLVNAAQVDRVLRERKHKAMFFIDIGDRRNFDGKINDLDNVYLYNIDDLRNVAEENLQGRSNEAAKAEGIVSEEVQSFVRWIGSLEQVPTITALRQRFDDIRRGEIDKSLGGVLKTLSPEQRAALEDMTTAMINKFLHAPITELKRRGDRDNDDEAALYLAALKKLFDLEGK
ncbi:MAG TPA: glutamyl-tRNA reductase [Candidatus Limnocylindrales bacterium]|nr:glutamyl-tRNA reductase [Candidatus Limnocylindrales bacterium]